MWMCAALHTFKTRNESRKMPMCANPHTLVHVGTAAQATLLSFPQLDGHLEKASIA